MVRSKPTANAENGQGSARFQVSIGTPHGWGQSKTFKGSKHGAGAKAKAKANAKAKARAEASAEANANAIAKAMAKA